MLIGKMLIGKSKKLEYKATRATRDETARVPNIGETITLPPIDEETPKRYNCLRRRKRRTKTLNQKQSGSLVNKTYKQFN